MNVLKNVLQEPLSPFLRGANFFPGNNVIYEKTIRKYELLNPLQVSWLFILSVAKENCADSRNVMLPGWGFFGVILVGFFFPC